MKSLISRMLDRLESLNQEEIISWAAPVPCFGNLERSAIATLGINPSNREFVDANGLELTSAKRRFHTLSSLGLKRWSHAGSLALDNIKESCDEYFFRNPYGSWFNRLTPIVAATGHSYYDRIFPACHIDLLPFATDAKWGTLTSLKRRKILRGNSDLLVQLLRESSLELIILNGQTVVSEFVAVTGMQLDAIQIADWSLPRSSGSGVPGIAYQGVCEHVCGESLERPLRVIGFNHNIQSSFGVTSQVVQNIAKWVKRQSEAVELA